MKNVKILDEYSNFSKNVRSYRIRKKLTQEQLAEKAYCSISYIKQIESCHEYKNVTLSTILNICQALDIKAEDLFKQY